MKFLTKGKRGEIYTAVLKGKKVIIKKKRKGSKAFNRIENESYWLKRLNKQKIGPKFLSFKNGILMMEYVAGEAIGEYLKHKQLNKALAKEVLEQCRVMDTLQVNKLEMTNPYKHILIKKGKASRKNVVMIDFERCKQTEKPKNVTQFCQYLLKKGWKVDRKHLRQLLQKYKQEYSSRSFRNLLRLFF